MYLSTAINQGYYNLLLLIIALYFIEVDKMPAL